MRRIFWILLSLSILGQAQAQEEEDFIIADAALQFRKLLRYSVCTDLRDACPIWAADGECERNPAYMGPHCPASCHTCALLQPRTTTTQPFSRVIPQTLQAAGWDFPDAVGRDLGVPQIIYNREHRESIQARVAQARELIATTTTTIITEGSSLCRNHNVNCTTWAVQGECENNPEYMHRYCAPVCFVCT